MIRHSYMYCFRICILHRVCKNFFEGNFPSELIRLIVGMIYEPPQLFSGFNFQIVRLIDSLYVWGSNRCGKLGLGDRSDRGSPQKCKFDEKIISVGCGMSHGIGLAQSGNVYTWGNNFHGQLGSGDDNDQCKPYKIQIKNVIKVACGEDHILALIKSGELYGWGRNVNGQLGLGYAGGIMELPHKVILHDNLKIHTIVCGVTHTIILATYGTNTSNRIYVWGGNYQGQLGLGDTNDRVKPQELVLPNVKAIACADNRSMAITKDNNIWIWGYNKYGRYAMGNGLVSNDNIHMTPQKLLLTQKLDIGSIHCGRSHMILLTKNGEMYGLGATDFGQLGFQTYDTICLPQKLITQKVYSVSCYHECTIFLIKSGSGYKICTWGENPYKSDYLIF